ncbi:MAG TPA: hypothetical protein DF383_08600, partial [Deltaproteobacteria bacterium]|nr:hypothetical protein [Deltaproteobacteria bacterium]
GGGGGGGNTGLQNLNFGTPLTLVAGAVPANLQTVVVGNFTDDNILDFAVLNDTVGVFVGKGDGTFQVRKDATSTNTGTTAL